MSDVAGERDPFRCFRGAFLRDAILVSLGLVLLAWLGRGFERGSPARFAVAAAQALLFAGLILATVRSIRRLDELMMKLHLEGIAISFVCSGTMITGWGMLEHAGAPRVDWGVWAGPLMALLWAVAVGIRSRQYR